jgi:hypothetical protein
LGHLGFKAWKDVSIGADLTTQVETAGFHTGGFAYITNAAAPPAIDLRKGMVGWYVDGTAGAPKIKAKTRDNTSGCGLLFAGDISGALSAVAGLADDDFAGANSATSLNGRAATTAGTWAVVTNNWGIATNKGYRSAGTGADWAYIDTGASDVSVECDITLSAVRSVAGLVIRGVDDTHYTYAQLEKDLSGNTNRVMLIRVIGGGVATIDEAAYTMTLGATYSVRAGAVGNQYYLYINDVLILTANDATHVAGTRQGIFSYADGSTYDDGGTRWDNFRVYT